MEREGKKDFYAAVQEYNRHTKRSKIRFNQVALELGISRQALSQLVVRGGKNGLNKYKDKLKEILPSELYEKILFPERMKRLEVEKRLDTGKVTLTNEEKERLKEVFWVVTKPLYNKVMDGGLVTQYMHDKIMKKVEEGEEWKRKNKEMVNEEMCEL